MQLSRFSTPICHSLQDQWALSLDFLPPCCPLCLAVMLTRTLVLCHHGKEAWEMAPWTLDSCAWIPDCLSWIPACSLRSPRPDQNWPLWGMKECYNSGHTLMSWCAPLTLCFYSGNWTSALTCEPAGWLSCHLGLLSLPWISLCLDFVHFFAPSARLLESTEIPTLTISWLPLYHFVLYLLLGACPIVHQAPASQKLILPRLTYGIYPNCLASIP